MSDSSTQVTDPSAFRAASLGKQVAFAVVTLGLYGIYWFHSYHKQLAAGTDADVSPGLRTLGMFVPVYNFVVWWRDAHDAEAVTDQDGVLMFVLFLVFNPAAWYLIQSGINEVAAGAD